MEPGVAFQTGERYQCADPACACEIEVVRGASPGKGGNLMPRCCCGSDMRKTKEGRKVA
jgi:hypothetical protein